MGLIVDAVKGVAGLFPGGATGGFGFRELRLPGDDERLSLEDFVRGSTPSGSSLVEAAVNWASRTFPEAPMRVRKPVQGEEEPETVPGHDLLNLLETPNPFYSGELLWMPTILSLMTDGNAYWLKGRAGDAELGPVVELWYVPHWMMEPKWPSDGSEFISHYEYMVNNQIFKLDPSSVVHYRNGISPENTRKGRSPLASLLREIFTDEEAARFSATMLKNLGVPGLVVSPGDTVSPGREAMKRTKEEFEEKFSGGNRGRVLVMQSPTKVEVLGFSPQQMDLRDLRRVPEERVAAVLGIPAIVLGFGAGLERSTFANFAEARQMAVESFMVPMWRQLGSQAKRMLLPDFERSVDGWVVDFDTSKVRVLQEDQDKLAERTDRMVRGGWMRVDEAQKTMGLPVDDSQAVYLRPLTQIAVPAEEEPTPRVMPGLAGLSIRADDQASEKLRKAQAALLGIKTTEPLAQALLIMRQRALPAALRAVAAVFVELGNAAADAAAVSALSYDGTDAKAIDPLPGDAEQKIGQVVAAVFEGAAESAWGLTDDALGAVAVEWDVTLPEVTRVLARGSENVTRITEGTRSALQGYMQENVGRIGLEDFTREDFKAGIRDTVSETYQGRSEAIARTELRRGSNGGTMARYDNAGVESVQAVDGTEHEPCASRNGTIYTLEQAAAEDDSEHPNGTLSFIPILPE